MLEEIQQNRKWNMERVIEKANQFWDNGTFRLIETKEEEEQQTILIGGRERGRMFGEIPMWILLVIIVLILVGVVYVTLK
jgi:hypothetical protein